MASLPRGGQPIRIFLVDDHEVVREGLRVLLEGEEGFEVVGDAGTAPAGFHGILATHPDVAVVDVRLPGGDGIQIVREVRSSLPDVRCIMLTSFPTEDAFVESVIAGAAGFLVKDVARGHLVDAVRRVAAGGSLVSAEMLRSFKQRVPDPPEDEDFLAELTPQERRVLDLVTDGLTNREIAERLHLAEKTVRNYVSTILSKLGMKNRTQVAAYVARTFSPGALTTGS